MLSSIKSGEPDWAAFQSRAIDDAFRLRDFLGGDEKSATFTARPLGDAETNAVVRLFPANDNNAAEKQIGLWLRAKELNHPNLVRILGAGRLSAGADQLIYVALEAADERLASVLTERRLEPDEAAEILKSVVNALERLHANGFVHGAVSPDQIFAVGDAIKLSAENIRYEGSHDELFSDAPKFLAPESKGVNATTGADIWCLGATLYECLTQESPDGSEFHHNNLPEPHRTIVRRTLDPDPQARGSLEEIQEIERGKRAAAAAAAAIAAAATEKPAAPETMAGPATMAAAASPAIPATPPLATRPTPETARPKAESPRPKTETPRRTPETLRPPALGIRYDTKPRREGIPVWAYGAGVVVIILALVLLLRPKHSTQKPAAAPASATGVPSAQQKMISPPPESSNKGMEANTPAAVQSRSKPSPQVRAQTTSRGSAATNGQVWRVIVYTYNARDDAQRQVETINRRHPSLKAEVFSASGDSAPYLVVVGGGMNRDEAKHFRQTAVNSGMPRDSYVQNFTR